MSVVIAIFAILAAFYLLAVLTEAFFVPAIDRIARKLKLSSDAAGATLLAMGSSAPEFFTALVAVLGLAGGGGIADVGAGTIVGSAIFNVLVIVGVAAMFKAVKLQWQPVARDMVFYVITILLLLMAFGDGRIVAWEAIGFIAVYGVYVWTVVKWRSWLKYDDVAVEEELIAGARRGIGRVVHTAISWLIPDPHKKPHLYPLTFVLAILGIGVLSWLLVDQVVVIANTLHINPTFLALTVIAAGTSVPDLIGSVVVAKQGRGDMAVSNAVGSNVFNILFALAFPWLLFMALGNGPVEVGTDNLLASVLLLLASVVAILFLMVARRWRLGRRSGLVLVGLYVAYVVYVVFTISH